MLLLDVFTSRCSQIFLLPHSRICRAGFCQSHEDFTSKVCYLHSLYCCILNRPSNSHSRFSVSHSAYYSSFSSSTSETKKVFHQISAKKWYVLFVHYTVVLWIDHPIRFSFCILLLLLHIRNRETPNLGLKRLRIKFRRQHLVIAEICPLKYPQAPSRTQKLVGTREESR